MCRSFILIGLGLAALAISLSACASVTPEQQIAAVRERAAYDLNCAPQDIELTYLQSSMYGAKGCRKQQNYVLHGAMVYKEGMEPPRHYYDSSPRFGLGVGYGHYRYR